MAITRTNRNQAWNPQGQLVQDDVVVVDITRESIQFDIHAKARLALTANATFLAIGSPTNAQTLAQVQRLTRECSGIWRLLLAVDGAFDLLVENTDT